MEIIGDWSAFTNYSKLGLSLFSIGFDLLFIVQHYICYPPGKTPNIEEIFDDANSAKWLEDEFDTSTLDSVESINSSNKSFTSANKLFRTVSTDK